MIRGIYTAAAGMAANLAKQDVIANNLANMATNGFKENLAIFRAREDQHLQRVEAPGGARAGVPSVQAMGDVSSGVYLDEVTTHFEQGPMRQTDEPLDLALSGEGFFVVRDAQGAELLSRGGTFTRDAEGFLADSQGHRALGAEGPIALHGKERITIDKAGHVSQGKKQLGQLRVVQVQAAHDNLAKRGDTLWTVANPASLTPVASTEVMQGYLEGSNVNPMKAMVDLIDVQRSYEASQRMILAQDETLGKAVGDLGRV